MGSRVGTVVRVLASHQCGLGLILARCHLWVEFVVSPHLAPSVFLQVLFFLPPEKATFLIQLIRVWLLLLLLLLYFLFLYLFIKMMGTMH